jgi:outer membrane protein TolC
MIASAATWTLPEAVRFARENNPDSRLAVHRIAVAEAMLLEARSGIFPNFSVRADYIETTRPMNSFGLILNQGRFDPSIDFNNPGQIDNGNLTGSIQWRLYSGGATRARIEAAKAGKSSAGWGQEAIQRRLDYLVAESYFHIRQAEETVELSAAAVTAFGENLEVARQKYRAGAFLKTEVLNLEVQLSQSRENLVQANHALALAKRGFLNVLGLKSGEVEMADPEMSEALLKEPLTHDYGARPELAAARDAVRAARANLRAAEGGRHPTVDAFADYGYDHGWDMDGSGNSFLAGVRVNLNVFDGFRTTARIRAEREQLRAAEERVRQEELNISFEVERARLAYEQAKERLEVTAKIVTQARESAELSRARFEEGVILSSELIDTETRLTEARARRAIARARRNIALADLRRALGQPLFSETPEQS